MMEKRLLITMTDVKIDAFEYSVTYYIDKIDGINCYILRFVEKQTGVNVAFANNGEEWFCDFPIAGMIFGIGISALDKILGTLRDKSKKHENKLLTICEN